jgi:glycosyltransferase involved in cell wall biosynthesis
MVAMRILLVPSSDYLGHPFPQRHNHIFEHLSYKDEVHVVRFKLYPRIMRDTHAIIHDLPGECKGNLGLYYALNIVRHTSEIRRIVHQESIDCLVLSNLSAPLGYRLVRYGSFRIIPVIFDLQDYYPSAAGFVAEPGSLINTFFTGALEIVQNSILQNSDYIVAASGALFYLAQQFGRGSVAYIPNGISEVFLNPPNVTITRDQLGIHDSDIVLGFVGSIEFWFDFETVVRAARALRERGIPVRVLLIGGSLRSGYLSFLKKMVKSFGLDEVFVFAGFVRQDLVPRYLSLMDLCLAPFRLTSMASYYAGPNKFWEYLSQSKPVLTSEIPDAIVNRKYLSLYRDYDGFVNSVLEFLREPDSFIQKAKIGSVVAKNMTWKRSANQYSQLLHSLLGS